MQAPLRHQGSPAGIDPPERANIERVNLKSDTKPFLIVSPVPCLRRNLQRSSQPVYPDYRQEPAVGELCLVEPFN